MPNKFHFTPRPENSGRKIGTHKNPHWGLINSCFGKSGVLDRLPVLAAFGQDKIDGVNISYMEALEKLCGTTNHLALEE